MYQNPVTHQLSFKSYGAVARFQMNFLTYNNLGQGSARMELVQW
jgi:hypothetical protein